MRVDELLKFINEHPEIKDYDIVFSDDDIKLDNLAIDRQKGILKINTIDNIDANDSHYLSIINKAIDDIDILIFNLETLSKDEIHDDLDFIKFNLEENY